MCQAILAPHSANGPGYSSVAERFVDADLLAAAWTAVTRYAPALGLTPPESIRVDWFREEIDNGTRTAHGDPVFHRDYAEWWSLPGYVLTGLCQPHAEPNVIRINAGLRPVGVYPAVAHELGHLVGASEDACCQFEVDVRKEMNCD